MDITMESWLHPICHEGDWDGTRPGRGHKAKTAGLGPVGADDRALVEETGRKNFSPLTAGVILCAT